MNTLWDTMMMMLPLCIKPPQMIGYDNSFAKITSQCLL